MTEIQFILPEFAIKINLTDYKYVLEERPDCIQSADALDFSSQILVDLGIGSTTSTELIPVSGVRTATFFLPVEPHLKFNNKMNSHFTLEHYSQGLATTCQFLTKLDHPAYVLGDQAFIQSRAATCSDLAAEENFRYAMDDLKHEEAASMVQRHMCRRKFATDKHDARRILKEHGEFGGCLYCLYRYAYVWGFGLGLYGRNMFYVNTIYDLTNIRFVHAIHPIPSSTPRPTRKYQY